MLLNRLTLPLTLHDKMQIQKHYETQSSSCLQGKKTAVNYSHVVHISTRATAQQKDSDKTGETQYVKRFAVLRHVVQYVVK